MVSLIARSAQILSWHFTSFSISVSGQFVGMAKSMTVMPNGSQLPLRTDLSLSQVVC